MITFIVHLQVRPENAEAYEALMTEVAALTRANEPGVLYYAFAKSVTEPDIYVVVEVYADVDVHAAHMALPWVTENLPKTALLIEGKPRIEQYVTPGTEPVTKRLTDFP